MLIAALFVIVKLGDQGAFSRPVNKLLHTQTRLRACVLHLSVALTLCDPVDCSFLGSSVHGILQARILEWVVTPFSRGTSQPRDQTHISYVSCIGRRVLHH